MELKECDLDFIRKCRVLYDDFPMELPGIETLSACYQRFVEYDSVNVFPWLTDAALEVFKEHAQNKHRMRFYVECLRRINYFLMDANLQHFIIHIGDPGWEDESVGNLCLFYNMFVGRHTKEPERYSELILELTRPQYFHNFNHLRSVLETISTAFRFWLFVQYKNTSPEIISTYNILARVGNIFDGR